MLAETYGNQTEVAQRYRATATQSGVIWHDKRSGHHAIVNGVLAGVHQGGRYL
ncbi:protein ninH [Salmonella enterica subsp. enterica]|nr:protein ninH [Salmonella enterica subsp. enterica]